MALPVLYRDEYYVAVNKPAGLLVHPTPEAAGERDTVISRLPPQIGVDQWQRPHEVRKEYVALVAGATPSTFECTEPLTNRKVQTARKRKQKQKQKQMGEGFDVESIGDAPKRRYVAALVALCEAAGGSATVAALSEQCRAEDYGLPKGVGLRATVSEWPRLWAIRKECLGGSDKPVRVVRLLRTAAAAAAEQPQEQEEEEQQQQGLARAPKRQRIDSPSDPTGDSHTATTAQAEPEAAAAAGSADDERQPAHTLFRRLGEAAAPAGLGAASLLLAELRTGRRHQIRRHLAKRRTPILGDVEYGKGRTNRPLRELGLGRPFLHALRLSFGHPVVAGRRVCAVAPLPEALERFLRTAGMATLADAVAAEAAQAPGGGGGGADGHSESAGVVT